MKDNNHIYCYFYEIKCPDEYHKIKCLIGINNIMEDIFDIY